jgi:hypothetical protein
MGFSSIRQSAVAACWGGRCVLFLGALLVQVNAPTLQTAGRLLAVCSDKAEVLVVMALRKTILSCIYFYPDCDVAEAWQPKISWDFPALGKVIRKRGRFMIFDTSVGDRRVAVICFTLITSKPMLTSPSDMSSVGVLCGRRRVTAFRIFFFGFGVERVIGQVIGVEVNFDGLEILHVSRDDSGSVSSATELKVFFDHTLQLLLQLNGL